MVHGDSYNGDITRNPFYFEKFGLQTPKMLVNGEEYPSEPIVLVHDDEARDILGYDKLIRQSGALIGAREMLTSSEDWSHGSTILIWNNIPDTLSSKIITCFLLPRLFGIKIIQKIIIQKKNELWLFVSVLNFVLAPVIGIVTFFFKFSILYGRSWVQIPSGTQNFF